MNEITSPLSLSQPDPALIERLAIVHSVVLGIVTLIALVILAGWSVAAFGAVLPCGWANMHAHTALAALFSALALASSKPERSQKLHRLSLVFSVGVAILAAAILAEYWLNAPALVDNLGNFGHRVYSEASARMTPQSGTAFSFLAVAIALIRARTGWKAHVADLAVSALCFVVLFSISAYLAGAMRLFGIALNFPSAPQTLLCLTLLTFVAFWRRAECGVFSILLGWGIGSRIARNFSPFVLLLPFLREIARAHALRTHFVLPEIASAGDTACVALGGFALLLFLALRINRLEREVLDLSLRDELTGLYNRKGFLLLAGQALEQAKRSNLAFSVLFIDLDGLKEINDTYGHDAGSRLIAEIGNLLKSTFREADVIGRIGGDEFVVAGQLDADSCEIAILRLHEAAAQRNIQPGHEHFLNFSAGSATSEESTAATLDQLITRADHAMYEDKNRRKLHLA